MRRVYAALAHYPAVASLVAFSIGTFAYGLFFRNTTAPQNLITVTRGTITETVVVTGKTKPIESVDLAFERSGAVARVRAAVGDSVLSGQIILELEQGELRASLTEAEANLEGEQAKLGELTRGTRPEEIKIKQTELDKAKQALLNYYGDIPNALNDGYTKADDAVRNQMDSFFTNDETTAPQLSFPTANSQIGRDTETERVNARRELNAWKTELASIARSSPQSVLGEALGAGETHLAKIQIFLDKATDALNGSLGLLSSSAFTSYKTALTNARNAVNAAITSAANQAQSIAAEKIAAQELTDELNLDLAGSAPEAIAAQEARVKQALAQKDRAKVNLLKTILRSPIAGVLVKQDGKAGEIAAANVVVASVISQNKLDIEANIPEVDIGKIAIKNPARITIDAFPNETFSGNVLSVDPAETILDGAVNFKIKIAFDAPDPRIKSGLTANLAIETKTKTEVLMLPQFAILETDRGSFVRKAADGTVLEAPVTTGIRSEDGHVEILSGVREGDRVLNIGAKAQ